MNEVPLYALPRTYPVTRRALSYDSTGPLITRILDVTM